MAKQEPQQPFFIPRVAGVTPPPPKPQPQPEVQAPPKAVFRPTVAAPLPPLQPKPVAPPPGEAAFQPNAAAPPPPLQPKPVAPAPGEAAFQSTVTAPPLQPKPVIPAPGEAAFQSTVTAPPPQLQPKPVVQAPAEAVFQPTATAPPPQLQPKPVVQSPAEAAFQPTVTAPPPQLKPVVQAPAEAVFQPAAAVPSPPPQLKPVVQAPAEAMFQSTVAAATPPQMGRTPFPAPPKRQGRKGILVPVLAGLFLCVVLVALVSLKPSLLQKVQELAAPQKSGTNVEVTGSSSSKTTPQSPPVYPEGASRVEEKELGFSFAVPQGYQAASEKDPDNLYLFERKLFTEPTRTVLIRKVNDDYPRGTGTGADLSTLLDGHAVSTVTFDWRGRALEGSRSLDPNPAKPFAVFTVVVPLREQRVLLEVGGSVESEAVIREVMDQVLASLGE